MTKLVLKCGDIEVEYDGPEDFLKKELSKLIEEVTRLRAPPSGAQAKETAAAAAAPALPASGTSVSTIAQKLGVTTGSALVMAAALSLSGAGTTGFTKKELRDRVKEAKTFYKASYQNNFDNMVARHVKRGRINHVGGENYSLPDAQRKTLLQKIAEATA